MRRALSRKVIACNSMVPREDWMFSHHALVSPWRQRSSSRPSIPPAANLGCQPVLCPPTCCLVFGYELTVRYTLSLRCELRPRTVWPYDSSRPPSGLVGDQRSSAPLCPASPRSPSRRSTSSPCASNRFTSFGADSNTLIFGWIFEVLVTRAVDCIVERLETTSPRMHELPVSASNG